MVSFDLRDVVGNVVNRTGRVRWIRQATQLVERSTQGDRWNLIVDVLGPGKKVRIIDAISRPVEETIGRVDADPDTVHARGGEDFVYQRRADGPDVVERGSLIRA